MTPPDDWVEHNVILQVEVGSTAHGTGLPGVEDRDEMAIVLEPRAYRLGLQQFETRVYRPGRGPGERSQPGDWDLQIHSLHKWVSLALKGNPSIIMALWAPVVVASPVGRALRELAPTFIGRHLVPPFLGYAEAQRQKLTGERGGKHTNRPELVEQHGYDTKYAMHMLRLGFQGREVLEHGSIQFPARQHTLLSDVRKGKYSLDEVLEMARVNEGQLRSMHWGSSFGPQTRLIEDFMIGTYMRHYAMGGGVVGLQHPTNKMDSFYA